MPFGHMNKKGMWFVLMASLSIARGEPARSDSAQTADGVQHLSKVVVTEHRSEEGAARAEQKYVSNIVNIITSQEIQKLPDVNAAEALRHVQGISLWSDTGEGRFVAIRGLDSDLNSTTFNGVRLLPTNPATVFGGGRAVALDVIPAGMIGSIAVTKTNKPEQDAEALGGTIDIVPKSIPVTREGFLEGRFGTGYENLNSTPIADISVTGGLRFGLGNGGAPSGPPNFSDKPFSFVGTASVYADARGIDDVEPGLINSSGTDRAVAGFDQRFYKYHRTRHAFGGELGYRPDGHNRYFLSFFDTGYKEYKLDNILTINFDGNPTTADNRIFQDTISDGAYQKALVNHTEKLIEQIAIFGGENEIGGMLLDYKAAYMLGKYEVLKDLTTTFNSVGSGSITYDNSGNYPVVLSSTGPDKTNPANYTFGNYRSALPLNKTTEGSVMANLTIPVSFVSSAKETVKFGGSYRDKTYHADTQYFSGPRDSALVGSPSLNGYTEGSNVVFYDKVYFNGPNLSPSLTDGLLAQGGLRQTTSNLVRTLNAHARDTEKVAAEYFQYNLLIGKLDLLAGARLENTKGTYKGNIVTDDQFAGISSRSKTYTDFFPAISVKYELDQSWQIRAGRSSTIARPGFNQISSNIQVDTGGNSVTTGNPNLSPTKSDSYDLTLERYLSNGGIFSIGVFYKKLTDYIVSNVSFLDKSDPLVAGYGFSGSKQVIYQSYTNASNAHAGGFEFGYEQRFKNLPGLFSGLGASANYTYVDSQFDIRPGESHALPSASKNTYNAALFYELHPVSVRLSLAHVDKFLSGIGSDATEDLYTDPINLLDLGIQYQISRTLGVYLNVKNLLDSPVRYTQGTTNRTIQREFYGQSYQLGVTAKF